MSNHNMQQHHPSEKQVILLLLLFYYQHSPIAIAYISVGLRHYYDQEPQ
jgi:hypothetical protein